MSPELATSLSPVFDIKMFQMTPLCTYTNFSTSPAKQNVFRKPSPWRVKFARLQRSFVSMLGSGKQLKRNLKQNFLVNMENAIFCQRLSRKWYCSLRPMTCTLLQCREISTHYQCDGHFSFTKNAIPRDPYHMLFSLKVNERLFNKNAFQ